MAKRMLIIFIFLIFLFKSTDASKKDSLNTNKHWNYGFSLYNTLYWVDHNNTQHLNNGLGILTYADYKIFKNLFIDFGIGIKKIKLTQAEKSFKILDLCMPLSIKYSFIQNKKTRKVNFYLKAGILREAVISTKFTDILNLYSNDFAYKTKDVIGNILFYKHDSNINEYCSFINIGSSYSIFKKYRLTLEIEYISNSGQKETGLYVYQEIPINPNNLGLKIGVIF